MLIREEDYVVNRGKNIVLLDDQAVQGFAEDLELAIETATKNPICLYQGCKKPPIGSHLIARKTLQVIAEKNHVLKWIIPSVWDMIHAVKAGISLEKLNQDPLPVGIRNKRKVTEPLFCEDHDGPIFLPLEQQEFAFKPEQVLLLAYRASCSFTFPQASLAEAILEVSRKYSYVHSLDNPKSLQKLKNFQAVSCIVSARQRYTDILCTQEFSQLGYATHLVNQAPCLAASYSLIPMLDKDDAQSIVSGTCVLTAEDVVSFSFLPYPPLNKSVCVISWFRGGERAQHFLTLNRINEVSEKERGDIFLHFSFESPTLYISPSWWKALNPAKKEEYKEIRLNAGRDHADLV